MSGSVVVDLVILVSASAVPALGSDQLHDVVSPPAPDTLHMQHLLDLYI